MADERRGIKRWVSLFLDPSAALRMEKAAEESLRKAGHAGGEALEKELQAGGSKAVKALTSTLKREYESTMAAAQLKLGKGLIPQAEFDRIKREATATFNGRLIPAMERLQAEGKLTETQFAQLSRQIKKTGDAGERDVGRAGSALGRLKGIATGLVAAFVAAFALDRLKQFTAALLEVVATAEDTRGYFETVFTYARTQAESFVEAFANIAGMTRTEMRAILANAGSIMQAMGMTQDASLKFGERLIRLAADLRAATGGTLQEAITSMMAAFRGEYDPLERYGIMLSATEIKQRALTATGKTHEDQLTKEDRAVATLAAAYEMAGKKVGQFDREMGGLSQRTQEIQARYREWKEQLAYELLPTFEEYAAALTKWVGENKSVIDETIQSAGTLLRFLAALAVLAAKAITITVNLAGDAADFVRDVVTLGPAGAAVRQVRRVASGAEADRADAMRRGAEWAAAERTPRGAPAPTEAEAAERAADYAAADARRRAEAEAQRRLAAAEAGRTASARTAAGRLAQASAEARREAELLATVWDGPLSAAPESVRRLLGDVLKVEKEIGEATRERAEAAKRGNDTSGLTARLGALNAERESAERLLRALAPLEAAYEQATAKARLERAANRLTPEQAEAAAASAAAVFNAGLADAIRSAEAEGPLTAAMQDALGAAAKQVRAPADGIRLRRPDPASRAALAALPDDIKVEASAAKAQASLNAGVDLLGRALGLRRLTGTEIERARGLEAEILREMEKQGLSAERLLELEAQLGQVRQAIADDSALTAQNAFAAIARASEAAAGDVTGHWADVFEQLLAGTIGLGEAWSSFWRGTLAAVASALRGEALLQAAKEGALMFGALAKGNLPAAGLHAKAALGWSALAGAAGAASGAIAGGGQPAAALARNDAGRPQGGTENHESSTETHGYQRSSSALALGTIPVFPMPRVTFVYPMPQMPPLPDPLTGYAASAAFTADRARGAALGWAGGGAGAPIHVHVPTPPAPEVHLHGSLAALALSPDFQQTVYYANAMGEEVNGRNAVPRPPGV